MSDIDDATVVNEGYSVDGNFVETLVDMIVSRHIKILKQMRDEDAEASYDDRTVETIARAAVELDLDRCIIDDNSIKFFYKTSQPDPALVINKLTEMERRDSMKQIASNIMSKICEDVEIKRAMMDSNKQSKH